MCGSYGFMDNAAHKVLESSIHRTLHANSFSRASTQATFVLTDLLSRYLQLLTASCAKYSQHAGRSNISIRDVVGALDDLGLSVDELGEFFTLEGRDLSRYAVYTPRRAEDMNEFKSQSGCALRVPQMSLTSYSSTARGVSSRQRRCHSVGIPACTHSARGGGGGRP